MVSNQRQLSASKPQVSRDGDHDSTDLYKEHSGLVPRFDEDALAKLGMATGLDAWKRRVAALNVAQG